MSSVYCVRFDDVCPTMPWDIWSKIESILDTFNVKPLLAVIPDNKDPAFHVSPPVSDFWEQVRRWQSKGWAIGIHGLHHQYMTQSGGLLGIGSKSEFAGISKEEQQRKISLALKIFRSERVVPEAFVAPSHSFDRTTLQVLRDEGVRVMSDGLLLRASMDSDGMIWVPQQLWRFRPMWFGEWTVCFHATRWTDEDLRKFEQSLRVFHKRCIAFQDLVEKGRYRTRSIFDTPFLWSWRLLRLARRSF